MIIYSVLNNPVLKITRNLMDNNTAILAFFKAGKGDKEMNDTFRHKGLRKNLVALLREKGIQDEEVLAAMEAVPRHLYLDLAFMEHAYEDKAFKIGAGQTISQPYTVAFMTELLQVRKGEKILEVGTGSAYQASILVELGAKVYTIERQKLLFDRSRHLLKKMHYNAKCFYGDGYAGLPSFAPFDKIIVTAGAPYIPNALVQQLVVGGRMAIPVGEGGVQTMILIEKKAEDNIVQTELGTFRFVPLLEDKAWAG